jgi:hypothetical protein
MWFCHWFPYKREIGVAELTDDVISGLQCPQRQISRFCWYRIAENLLNPINAKNWLLMYQMFKVMQKIKKVHDVTVNGMLLWSYCERDLGPINESANICHARRSVMMYSGSTSSARRDSAPTGRQLGPFEGDELRMNYRVITGSIHFQTVEIFTNGRLTTRRIANFGSKLSSNRAGREPSSTAAYRGTLPPHAILIVLL